MSRVGRLSGLTKILVAVDGSSYAEKAGFRAAEVAQRFSAELVVLHVAKYPPNSLGISSTHTVAVGLPLSDPGVDNLKHSAIYQMKKISEYAKKFRVPADEQVIDTSSLIVESIVNFAYRNEIDLIVTGSRGMNAYRETLLGSVSEGVMRETRYTTMVVR
jgi:nucleotide-binding universal stress UspA family protein